MRKAWIACVAALACAAGGPGGPAWGGDILGNLIHIGQGAGKGAGAIETPPAAPGTTDDGRDKPKGIAIVLKPDVNVATPADLMRDEKLEGKYARAATKQLSNQFHVEYPNFDKIAVQQKGLTTCWAACAQMLLAADHRKVDQDAIVEEFKGKDQDADQSAGLWEVTAALCPDQYKALEQKYTSFVSFTPVNTDHMIRGLMTGKPMIVGLVDPATGDGHACVVYGATFAKAAPRVGILGFNVPKQQQRPRRESLVPDENEIGWDYALAEVNLYDPFMVDGGAKTMSAAEFKARAQFLMNHPIAEYMIRQAQVQQSNAKAEAGKLKWPFGEDQSGGNRKRAADEAIKRVGGNNLRQHERAVLQEHAAREQAAAAAAAAARQKAADKAKKKEKK